MGMTPDIATCIYYTGIDPFTKREVYVARHSPAICATASSSGH